MGAYTQNTQLQLTSVMKYARAISEEYITAEIDKVINQIREKAIAKAMIPINEKLKVFSDKFDFDTKQALHITLKIDPLKPLKPQEKQNEDTDI